MKRFFGFAILGLLICMAPRLNGYQLFPDPPDPPGPPHPKWGGGATGTSSGGDIDWLFDAAGTPDMAGGPATKDGEWTVLIGCLQDWETATDGNLDLRYVGTTSAAIITGDGNHIARWEDSSFPSFPVGGPLPGGVIGICTFDYTGAVMEDADVEFNGVGFDWSDPVLMKKVALHEFGHAFGFAHESTEGPVPVSAGGWPISIMYPSVTNRTDLGADDITGAVFLYGSGGGTDGIDELAVPPEPPYTRSLPRTYPPPAEQPPATDGSWKVGQRSRHSQSNNDDDNDGKGLTRLKNKYCVVATAACGSEDVSRVDKLRAMRDRSLRSTRSGSSAVSTYENAAAPVAQVVKQSEVLRALVRGALSR